MKRFTTAIMLCALIICLVGCNLPEIVTEPSEALPTSPSVPSEPDPTVPSVWKENLYAVSMPLVTEYTSDDEYNTLFEYTYQNMYLTMPDVDVADKIIVDYLKRLDSDHLRAEQVHMQAIEDFPDAEQWQPYTYQVTYNTARIDQGVLSLFCETSSYAGGQRSDRSYCAANYDMLSGDILTLGSILYHLDSKQALCQLINSHLEEMKSTTALYSYYEEAVEEYFQQDESTFEDFYFTKNGLCFFFAPYEIAPYASGMITVELPYAELTGIIGDQFFPAERPLSDGSIFAELLTEEHLDQFRQFTELTTDDGGEQIVLYTDSILQDVQIRSGYWNEEGTAFYTTAVVYAANVLTGTDAIILETFIPDVMPILLLSFDFRGQTFSYFIDQSGMDGSIILQEAFAAQ